MVTLKQFLDICKKVVDPFYCHTYIEKEDENYGTITERVDNLCSFNNIEELEPYYDYEIISFEQYFTYGELDEQCLYLKEVK